MSRGSGRVVADLGVHVQEVASTLNVLVGGHEVTSYMEGGDQALLEKKPAYITVNLTDIRRPSEVEICKRRLAEYDE